MKVKKSVLVLSYREILKGVMVNVDHIHWKSLATNNSKKNSSETHANKADKYL